jgi:5-deoxy-glucuronate isomerase
MGHHYKAAPLKEGYNPIVEKSTSSLRWLESGRVALRRPSTCALETGPRELAMTLLRGEARVAVSDNRNPVLQVAEWRRDDPFSEKPTIVFAPRNSTVEIRTKSQVDMGIFFAEARSDGLAIVVTPEKMKTRNIGKATYRRRVAYVPPDISRTDRLVVGETVAQAGNWSSYPPHKHDTTTSSEIPQEEVYFYLVDPPEGFAIQRLYSHDEQTPLDETCVVGDGDTVAIHHGYHPVVAAGGYRLFYWWALAGDAAVYGAWTVDPLFRWLAR